MLAWISVSAQSITLSFSHTCDDSTAVQNEFLYHNAIGTTYQICQIQYFISNVAIHTNNGWIQDSTIRYIDIDIPSTLTQVFTTSAKAFTIDSVRFTFGIPDEQNTSFIFRNAPENRMFWPESLGGGYHYMKLNIAYKNQQDSLAFFNCHLGKGIVQNKESTYYQDNSFSITLPCSIQKEKRKTATINISMDVNEWFKPNIIDFNKYHGIMDNHPVMNTICNNGKKAFSIKNCK